MESTETLDAVRDDALAPAGAAVATPAPPAPLELPEERIRMGQSVRDAWTHRGLLPRMAARFLAKFIAGTKLGRAWLLIRPLMDSLGMTLLFGGVLKVATPGAVPYYLFLMSGLLSWRLFERTAMYATRSFSVYRKLMKKFRFPLLLVPLGGLAYPVVNIAVYWAVFAGAVVFYRVTTGDLHLETSVQLLLVVPGILLGLAFTIGFVLWASVLNAKARDVRYTLRYVLPIWMFVTPVVYPLSQLPPSLRWVAVVNPMSAPVELVREGLLGVGGLDFTAVAWSVLLTAVLLVSGLWYFNREAHKLAEGYAGPDEDEEEGGF